MGRLAGFGDNGLTQTRRRRLERAMEQAPFDGWVTAVAENVFYATGFRSMVAAYSGVHETAWVVSGRGAWLVCRASEAGPATDAGIDVSRVVPFGRFYFESREPSPITTMADVHGSFDEALASALAMAGPVVRWGADAAAAPRLRRLLPAAVVEDAGTLISAVRQIKLPGEVERLSLAARLAEAGIEAALAEARPGVTERELAATVAATMAAGGGEPRLVVVTCGDRSALSDAYATDRPWLAGELGRFDIGCVVDGYYSDMARTAVLGEPDETQASRYAALLAGEQAQLDLARPGTTAGELFDVAVRTVEAHGLRPYRRHHCGHGIGASMYEPPIVSSGVADVLQAGMTFCLETPFYELGWGGMMVEDTVVVTDGPCVRLTVSDRSLRVVPT